MDARDSKAMTPLIVSATYGYAEIAGALLDAGADPELEDDAHWRAIHHVAFNGRLEVTELLLSNGVDVNIRAARGETPLWVAAGYGRTQVVEYLLKNGADPNIANNAGETPIQHSNTKSASCCANSGQKYNLAPVFRFPIRSVVERETEVLRRDQRGGN